MSEEIKLTDAQFEKLISAIEAAPLHPLSERVKVANEMLEKDGFKIKIGGNYETN